MGKSSIEKRRRGRYLKATERKKQRRMRNIVAGTAIMAVCVALLMCFLLSNRSVYQTLCSDGYTGTQEQLLASLIGEEAGGQEQTAYDLAVENGYSKSYSVWMRTLTKAKSEGNQKTPYQVACENGYQGTLTQWLTQLAENPETLGRSNSGEKQTEYEIACENGYVGSFIEWLVALANDRVF